jgi:hypothetical protein
LHCPVFEQRTKQYSAWGAVCVCAPRAAWIMLAKTAGKARVCRPFKGFKPTMSLTTIRVLLVEDEIMIRMMVADMVEELGHVVTAEAGDVGRAADLAQTGLFDLPFSMSI